MPGGESVLRTDDGGHRYTTVRENRPCDDIPRYVVARRSARRTDEAAGQRRPRLSRGTRSAASRLALRSAVHALGLRYRVNYRPVPGLRRTADLTFTRAKVAVFLDGCFWHGCPEHMRPAKVNESFWSTKIAVTANATRTLIASSAERAGQLFGYGSMKTRNSPPAE